MAIDILQENIRKTKNPTVLALDLAPELIPDRLLQENTLAGAYRNFSRTVLETLRDIVPAVRIQPQCFYVLGAEGVAAMDDICRYAKELGYYVLLDAMVSLEGRMAEVYAASIFGGDAPYDAVTMNGYLGSDIAKPFLPYCKEQKKNLFVMVKSANRSGREVQDLISGDRIVHTAVADLVARWGHGMYGAKGFSEIGMIVGATYPDAVARLRQKYERQFFLVTGYGMQGGFAKHVAAAFDAYGRGAAVYSPRTLLEAWKKDPDRDYAACVLDAAIKMKKDIARFVTIM